MKDQIWLIGFMGTGKTRVARPLAAALDWHWVDVDKLVEIEAGDSIPGIFRSGGEAAFRVLESQVVERLSEDSNVIIATGGGTVLSEQNREIMRRRGFIVCLDARPETIAARVGESERATAERPLLSGIGGNIVSGGDPLARIIAIKAERQPLYAQADFIIQTDDLTPDQITHQVLMAYREQSAVGAGGAA